MASLNARRLFVAVLVLFLLLVIRRISQETALLPLPLHQSEKSSGHKGLQQEVNETVLQEVSETEATGCILKTLYPGELPGYTGWARNGNTLAGSFQMIDQCTAQAVQGRNWTCSVHCSHSECLNGGSLFFSRAYGPSIIPGLVTDHHNGTYDVTFMPLDAGTYTVEVVLTFSHHTAWENPLDKKAYEGYLLPGFPVSVAARATDMDTGASISCPEHEKPLRKCRMSELFETSGISARETGRWLVTENMMDRNYSSISKDRITQAKYEAGEHSVGFTMDYFPTTCSLIKTQDIMQANTLESCLQRSRRNSSGPLEIVMVGDSNFRIQENEHLSQFFGKTLKIHRINAGGSLERLGDEIFQRLKDLAKKPKDYIILFNIGLHEFMNCKMGSGSCTQLYREHLTSIATAVQEFPALLKVWQTTPAAWPKVRPFFTILWHSVG
jgi:hypothetical protein